MAVKWIRQNLELVIWMGAILWLAFGVDYHATAGGFCPFRMLGLEALTGLEACPGCGLGRSIAAALHAEWKLSWQHHWMGIPALLIICSRIVTLMLTQIKNQPGNDGYLSDESA
jgi:hypothetical protein